MLFLVTVADDILKLRSHKFKDISISVKNGLVNRKSVTVSESRNSVFISVRLKTMVPVTTHAKFQLNILTGSGDFFLLFSIF